FETIQAKYGAGGAQFLSDHPNPGNRTEYVNAEIATLPRLDHPVVTTAEFKRVHAVALKEKTLAAKDVQAGTWRKSGLYASGPGAVAGQVAQPVSQAGTASGTGESTTASAPRLGRSALGIGSRMVKYQGVRFSIDHPAKWQQSTGASGAVTLAPAGGDTEAGLAYGAMIAIEKQGGNGVTDAASLSAATNALAQRLSEQNGGLELVGQVTAMTVGGRPARVMELRGRSPVAEGGKPLAERDRLLTVARADGDLSYVVFVCPEPDVALLKPVFDAMSASFRAQ
ncbi:MAG: hypothetical protein ABI158_04760, partial [Edaphobacter sp.]